MADELFFAMLLVLVVVGGALLRPQSATCPPGSYVEGVGTGDTYRPAGRTQCLSVEPDYDCSGANSCHGRAPRWRVPMQIHCSGGTQPIVVSDRVVGCQHGGYP